VNLLEELSESSVTVVVPDVVLAELCGLRPDDPAAVAVRTASWIQIMTAPSVPASVQSSRLDPGEAAVLALALAPSQGETEVILDDLAARRCAATLGLRVRGTLSFLLVAKAEGRIPAVRPVLETLHQSGMRLSRDLIQHTLQLAGE
jgi:predicted nucleic acid-binding protein